MTRSTVQPSSPHLDPLQHTAHRPYALPDRPWFMYQRWHDLLFAHWALSPSTIAAHVPPGVELDLHDGQAWLGIVPFRMTNVRPRYAPPLPLLSALPEINVRTYVLRNGKAGVYFFSLDAGRKLVALAARCSYRLPYFHASMRAVAQGEDIEYSSHRLSSSRPAEFAARYGPIGDVAAPPLGSLEHWLTERYCLFNTDRRGRWWCAEVHHVPWPLQLAHARIDVNTMAEAAGIRLPAAPPLLHFARYQDVRVWSPRVV